MTDAHEIIARNVPLRVNPALSKDHEMHEVLIYCDCHTRYRLYVNGDTSIPDMTEENAPVYCPYCGKHCSKFRTAQGHSAGTFNVTLMRLEEPNENRSA